MSKGLSMGNGGGLTEEVCPDVASFCVDAEDGLEASPEGVERGSMAFDQKVIVSQPFGKVVVVHYCPSSLPHLACNLFGLVEGLARNGQEIHVGRVELKVGGHRIYVVQILLKILVQLEASDVSVQRCCKHAWKNLKWYLP